MPKHVNHKQSVSRKANNWLQVRLTSGFKAWLDEQASLNQESLSDFVRQAAIERAARLEKARAKKTAQMASLMSENVLTM